MKAVVELQKMRRWIKIAGVVVVILMIRVWGNVQAQRVSRKVLTLRLEADRLTYENGRLQMQIHQYVSPSRLDAAARERMMAPLAPAQRIGIQP